MSRYRRCDGCAWLNERATECPCRIGHALRFAEPRSPVDDEWGYYRRGHPTCPDRKELSDVATDG